MKSKQVKIRQTALVTGASSGIGLELAKLLASDGAALILVASDKARLLKVSSVLERAYKIPVRVIAIDLATDSAAASVYSEVKRMRVVPDILINCAGVGDWGEFTKVDLPATVAMNKTNTLTPTLLSRFFAADMAKKGGGKILNVASQAAFFPGPLMAVYYATKAYVLSFSESLAQELKEENITVTALCPGPVATRFAKRANLDRSALFKGHVASAKSVAKAGYKGMMRGKRIVLPGWRVKLQTHFRVLMPRKFLAKIVAHHQRRLY